jgi:crossover junction endonuclease MUS81
MVRWPEKLRSGKEAEKLPGIGPSISGKLSERMMLGGGFGWIGGSDADRIIDLHPEPERPTKSKKTLSVADPQASEPKTSKATTAKSRKAASYVPSYRSGPYAILIALLLHLERLPKDSAAALSLGKNELQLAAQPLCTASLSEGSGIAFSAISGALKILENKKLLVRTLLPPQFSLTKQGLALARKLYDAGEQASRGPLDATNLDQLMDSLPDLEGDEAPEETRPEKESVLGNAARGDAEPVPFTWPVGSFEVVLLVDVREIRSREDRNYLTDRLRQLGVPCELRNLELGDFLWVARRKGSEKYEEGRKGSDALATEEIVLDTLIERKREDDLAASILDGRFKEQKHRIRRSLLRSCFYIVERNGNASAAGGETVIGADALLAATMQLPFWPFCIIASLKRWFKSPSAVFPVGLLTLQPHRIRLSSSPCPP